MTDETLAEARAALSRYIRDNAVAATPEYSFVEVARLKQLVNRLARAYALEVAEPLVGELGLILRYFERGAPYWYGDEPKRRITAALAEYKQRKKV